MRARANEHTSVCAVAKCAFIFRFFEAERWSRSAADAESFRTLLQERSLLQERYFSFSGRTNTGSSLLLFPISAPIFAIFCLLTHAFNEPCKYKSPFLPSDQVTECDHLATTSSRYEERKVRERGRIEPVGTIHGFSRLSYAAVVHTIVRHGFDQRESSQPLWGGEIDCLLARESSVAIRLKFCVQPSGVDLNVLPSKESLIRSRCHWRL